MTRGEFSAALEALARAWQARDYERAASYFAEDVQYIDPLRYHHRSRSEVLRFYQDDQGHPQRTVWRTILFDEALQLGAAEYSYEGTYRYHGVALVEVRDGQITSWREYQHISQLGWESLWTGAGIKPSPPTRGDG